MTRAQVKIRDENRIVTIRIGGRFKPDIDENVRDKWQALIDLVAEVFDVPAGLIMKVNPKDIEVFIRSEHSGNPYEPQASERLGIGLYCENVMGRNRELLVSNARQDPIWADNPDVRLDMISYYGLPLKWSDESFFGTICILDSKERFYDERQLGLMRMFKNIIETDLKLIEANHRLKIVANTDPLTGIANRQHLCDVVKTEMTRHIEEQRMCSVAMIDLDHFKEINDLYGHRQGDLVLTKFVSFLKTHLCKEAFIGRYGGDEFVVFFPDTRSDAAEAILNGINDQMKDEPFFKSFALTFTFGITSVSDDFDDEMDVLDAADKIMMARKFQQKSSHRQS
jgi:diguanylate cyclase (GGDEF)-like protein